MILYDANGNQIGIGGSDANDATVATVEPMNDDIPRVYFWGAKPTTKDDVLAEMRYVSRTTDFHAYLEIKCQGTSSLAWPKKNYTIKLYEDAERRVKLKRAFRNWTKQNKFCLKANWIDLTHIRNVCTAKLWGQIVKTRPDFGSLPEELRTAPNHGAVDGFPILVFYNGVYEGRYTWNIPKDAWMFNMDENNVGHAIFCGESNIAQASLFRAEAVINGQDWSDELRKTTPTALKESFNAAINFVRNSTDDEFRSDLGNYFDVQSLIDRNVFGYVICDLDGYGKNQIFYSYNGTHWGASPYDLDSTWGLWWDGTSFVAASYPRSSYQDNAGNHNLLYTRLDSLFSAEMRARYKDLRQTVLSASNIIEVMEQFLSTTTPDMIAEDYAVTTGGGLYTEIPLQDKNNIQHLRQFVVDRLNYVDTIWMTQEESE